MASLQHLSSRAASTLTGSSAASKHIPLYSKFCTSSVESSNSVISLYSGCPENAESWLGGVAHPYPCATLDYGVSGVHGAT